jgi:beta-lactamase regulating signal transducer with metallopeptidase domain
MLEQPMTWLITSAITNALVAIPLAGLAWLIATRCRRPALAHLVWVAVLVKLLTPPIIAIPLPWQIDPNSLVARLRARPAPAIVDDKVRQSEAAATRTAEKTESIDGAVVRKQSLHRKPAATPVKTASESAPTGPPTILLVLGGLWIAGSACMGLRSLYLAWQFQRLLRKARSEEFMNIRLGRLAQASGFSNWPEVVLLDGVFSPLLWGFGRRARLVFPAELARRLDLAACDTLLLHELGHFARGDHWIRILELTAQIVFWWHPVVWIAYKGIEAAEEECVDAWVIERQLSPRRTYAEALLATIDFLNEKSVALPPVATGLGEISLLRRRLTLIMSNQPTSGLSAAGRWITIALVLVTAPLSPAVFASTPRAPRRAKAPTPAEFPIVESTSALSSISVLKNATDELAETSPVPAPRIPLSGSLTEKSATPWIPPSLWASALSPDGKYRLEARSVGESTRIILSNLSDGFKVDLSSDGIACVSFSGEGRFASGHQDGNVRVWDSGTGGIALNLKGSDAAITSTAFSRDGHLVAAGTADGRVLIWDATPGDDRYRQPLYELDSQHAAIGCVRWSPELDRLAISVAAWNEAEGPELLVWSLEQEKITQRLQLDRPAGVISWLSGDSIMSAGWDAVASIWELSTGEVTARLELDKNALSAAAWSPDCPLTPRRRRAGIFQETP